MVHVWAQYKISSIIHHISVCERLILNQTPTSAAPLELPLTWTHRARGTGLRAGLPLRPPSPKDTLQVACLSACKKKKKNMSRYFYCSVLWSSYRLLKQSPPLIFIGSLMGRDQWREEKEERDCAWIITIHLPPALSLSFLHLSEVEVMLSEREIENPFLCLHVCYFCFYLY